MLTHNVQHNSAATLIALGCCRLASRSHTHLQEGDSSTITCNCTNKGGVAILLFTLPKIPFVMPDSMYIATPWSTVSAAECGQASEVEAAYSQAPASRPAEAAVLPPVQLSAPPATTRPPPIKTKVKRQQPPAPTPPGVQQIPFMTQTSLTQHQPPAFDEELALSPTKSASPVEIGNGSPGAQSALAAGTGRAEQVRPGSQHGSPRHTAGTTVANNGQSPKDHKGPADEYISASPQAETNASPIVSAEPAGTANVPSADVWHASQDVNKIEDGINDPSQSAPADNVQDQESSAHSQSAEPGKVSTPPSSPVKQAIPFSSQANTKRPEAPAAAAPAEIQRAASLHQAATASSSGRDAMQPQASLPVDSHARAAAVAEAIKRASQAIEPDQAATQGVVQPPKCFARLPVCIHPVQL